MSNSSDRIAVVIGAASGIGLASAHALAADGCRVTFADRNVDEFVPSVRGFVRTIEKRTA